MLDVVILGIPHNKNGINTQIFNPDNRGEEAERNREDLRRSILLSFMMVDNGEFNMTSVNNIKELMNVNTLMR